MSRSILQTLVVGVGLALSVATAAAAPPKQEAPNQQAPKPDVDFEEGFPSDAGTFVEVVTNPYFAFSPGEIFHYAGKSSAGVEMTSEVQVTEKTRVILGITAEGVRERETAGGDLIEETVSWYAQDGDGNVWLMAEDSNEYKNGEVIDSEGSWEAGSNGAKPVLAMPAKPVVGRQFAQEPGPDGETAEITALDVPAKVPFGSYKTCLQIKSWDPKQPDEPEYDYYAIGVGLVLTTSPHGEPARMELVKIDH